MGVHMGSSPKLQGKLTAHANPFSWPEVEPAFVGPNAPPPSDEATVRWATINLESRTSAAVAARYRELRVDDFMAFPYESMLTVKVAIPLAQAKVAFALGHQLSCVSMAAMVAEMMCSFRLGLAKVHTNDSRLSKDANSALRRAGGSFAELPQSRRMGILHELKLISDGTLGDLKRLAKIRNDYLHALDNPHEKLADDAAEAYRLAVGCTKALLGYRLVTKGVVLAPEVGEYLQMTGTLQRPSGNDQLSQ
jgi:hypothetical protein